MSDPCLTFLAAGEHGKICAHMPGVNRSAAQGYRMTVGPQAADYQIESDDIFPLWENQALEAVQKL